MIVLGVVSLRRRKRLRAALTTEALYHLGCWIEYVRFAAGTDDVARQDRKATRFEGLARRLASQVSTRQISVLRSSACTIRVQSSSWSGSIRASG